MRRWDIWCTAVFLALFVAAAFYLWVLPSRLAHGPSASTGRRSVFKDQVSSVSSDDQLSPEEIKAILDPPKEKLPETAPPAELPLVTWGTRDYFPMIRKPRFLTAEQGDIALAKNEPVLGLAVGQEARAYSTNQLNKHELVLDEIAGIPVLVTY
jgi:hypothetical protein